jgi:hypothetical protein
MFILRVETGKDTLHGLRTAVALKASAQLWGYKSEAVKVPLLLTRMLHTRKCNTHLCVSKHHGIMMYGGEEA